MRIERRALMYKAAARLILHRALQRSLVKDGVRAAPAPSKSGKMWGLKSYGLMWVVGVAGRCQMLPVGRSHPWRHVWREVL